MRILLLISLFGYSSYSYSSLAQSIQQDAKIPLGEDETYLRTQVTLAHKLEQASSTLKTILQMDPDGRATRALGPLEVQLAHALGFMNAAIETSMAGRSQEKSSFNTIPISAHVKRKPLPTPCEFPPLPSEEKSCNSIDAPQCKLQQTLPNGAESAPQEKNFLPLKKGLDKLILELDQEFMTEVFCPWYQAYRLRLSTRAATASLPLQHALLLCALETSLQSAELINKERKGISRHLPLIVVRDSPYFTRSSVTWRALSTILASGLCDLSSWELSSHHAWAQPAFTLVQNDQVRSALANNILALTKGLYDALALPKLALDKRIDLFLYLIDPDTAARNYRKEIFANAKMVTYSKQQTPLIWAVISNHINAVLAILRDHNQDSTSESECDTDESFVENDSREKLDENNDLLLSAINVEDYKELAAIDYACLLTHTACIELLLNAGSVLPQITTLHKLVQGENVDSFKALLNHIEIPPEIDAAAREQKKTSVIALFATHSPKKEVKAARHRKGWRKKRKIHAKK